MGDDARLAFIKAKLEQDLSSVDLLWSLLTAALSSYRHDSVLKPFPPMFSADGRDFKDYALMEKTMAKCPNLVKLRSYLQHCESSNTAPKLDSKLTALLHWLMQPKNFTLQTCDKEKYSMITELTGQTLPVTPPSHVFEVRYNEASEEKFQARRGERDIIYAVHGSRVENFHSILNHGLQGHMSRNALFGEGIYLSGELSVSMPYAPTGSGWERSSLGDRLSCFVVCEIIDDEKYVKCSDKAQEDATTSNGSQSAARAEDQGRPLNKSPSRARISGSEGGDVPDKYYVVRNNDYLRVKYILLYAEKSKSKHAAMTWKNWFKEHKYAVMLVMYSLILVCVGLYNSPSFHYYVKRYMKQR